MREVRLRNPYIAVMKENELSYGGSQSWSSKKVMRKCGCGVIAGMDLLLYLSLYKEYCASAKMRELTGDSVILEEEAYLKGADRLRYTYLPLIPFWGMSGYMFALGINRYFKKNRIPLKASYGVLGRNLWNQISAMLAHDIPAVLLIGAFCPILRKKKKLTLYQKNAKGEYEPASSVCSHFVIVTGMDETHLRISSWGKEYYIDRKEYMRYIEKHGSLFVNNVCYIRKR